jgi:hypothetical protein
MPVLKFLCPTSRVYFDSGIRLDESSAAASRLKIVRVRCQLCRREHRFLLADGVLDPSDGFSKRRKPESVRARSTAGRASAGVRERDHDASRTTEFYFSQ